MLRDRRHLQRLLSEYKAELPPEQALTLPSSWYTDPAMAAFENAAVFGGEWQPLARVDQFNNPGDFVTVELAGEPLLIIHSDRPQAFFNVCSHHAAQVVTEPHGCTRRLVCPYHGWTYDRNGQLLSAGGMGNVAAFDAKEQGLKPVATQVWGPWVWVNLSKNPKPLIDCLAGITGPLESLNLSALTFYQRREYTLGCNWKVYVDNYLDGGYHIPVIHRGLASVLDDRSYTVDVGAGDEDRYCLQTCRMASAATKTGEVRTGSTAYYYWLHPNFMINAYEGVMDSNLVLPLGVDRCKVIADFWFTDVSESAEAFNAESVAVSDLIQQEDVAVCESVQRGLGSRAYESGRLAEREAGERVFHQALFRTLQKALSEPQD